MKKSFLIYFLFVLAALTGCHTQFAKRNKPGTVAAVLGREYFVPKPDKSEEYQNFSRLFNKWIQRSADVFIQSDYDSLDDEDKRPDFIFYSNGTLDWKYKRENGYTTLEPGRWGLLIENPAIIKLSLSTFDRKLTLEIIRVDKDSLILREYPPRPHVVY